MDQFEDLRPLLKSIWERYTDTVLSIATLVVFQIVVLDFFVSMRVSYFYRQSVGFRVHWTQAFKNCFISYLGGTTLAGIVRGISPGWARINGSVTAVALAWYCVMFFPKDLVVRTCIELKPVKRFIDVLCSINFAFSLGELGVEETLRTQLVSSSVTTTLICGVLCSCGGSIVSDWLNLRMLPHDELTGVQIPLKEGIMKSIFGTIVYYLIRDPHDLLWGDVGVLGLTSKDSIAVLATLDIARTFLCPELFHCISYILEHSLPGFQTEFIPQPEKTNPEKPSTRRKTTEPEAEITRAQGSSEPHKSEVRKRRGRPSHG
eukprot:gb/GECG01008114.1/.p1 GENE.gb/GECG01008114.1/~~gb/GECG01008114.1/.p1  ORF type:complete len:318 (+),score=18.53 gb/GECG01008114.1/:1-954(+)